MKGIGFAIGILVLATACASRPLPGQRQPEEAARSQTRFLALAVLAAAVDGNEPRLAAYLTENCQAGKNQPGTPCRLWLTQRLARLKEPQEALRAWAENPNLRGYAAYEGEGAKRLGITEKEWRSLLGARDVVWVFPYETEPLVLLFTPSETGYRLKGGR